MINTLRDFPSILNCIECGNKPKFSYSGMRWGVDMYFVSCTHCTCESLRANKRVSALDWNIKIINRSRRKRVERFKAKLLGDSM